MEGRGYDEGGAMTGGAMTGVGLLQGELWRGGAMAKEGL